MAVDCLIYNLSLEHRMAVNWSYLWGAAGGRGDHLACSSFPTSILANQTFIKDAAWVLLLSQTGQKLGDIAYRKHASVIK
ncbi:hypothetical protein V1477_011499 [Vespula maculifrons]|uniref:Uncharacterized protein n=1 Tax=Vespula maculifrons TaxID=7453 RepID=A0ABD2BZD3_VESMC